MCEQFREVIFTEIRERKKTPLKSDFQKKNFILNVSTFWSPHIIFETLRRPESSFSKEFSRKNCIQTGQEIKKSCILGVDTF